MNAALRRVSTIDGDDPADFRPSEPDRFAVVLRLFVGPFHGEGEESFDVTICTGMWLHDACERDGFVSGRHDLVVPSYNFDFIRQTLARMVERCSGSTWQDVATMVGRLGHWEFEDYDRMTT